MSLPVVLLAVDAREGDYLQHNHPELGITKVVTPAYRAEGLRVDRLVVSVRALQTPEGRQVARTLRRSLQLTHRDAVSRYEEVA